MTLQDIREKKFSRAFKGFADAEVESFVVQVGDAFEKQANEIKANKELADSLQTRLAEYEDMDREMRAALLTAQKVARELVDGAHEQESAILEEANASLEEIRQEARETLDKAGEEARETLEAAREEARTVREETERQKKQALEAIEEQALAMRIKRAREIDGLKQDIRELESLRTLVRNDIETMLRDSIGNLSTQLEDFISLPVRSMLEPETQQPDEPALEEPEMEAPAVAEDGPDITFAPYSPADIPGACTEEDEALPKLDFQT